MIKFKINRIFTENLVNSPVFASKGYLRIKSTRWSKFNSLVSKQNQFFKVSKFFGNDRLKKKKFILSFFISKKKTFKFKKFFNKTLLSTALLDSNLFISLAEAKFYIKLKGLFLNGKQIKSFNKTIKESDIFLISNKFKDRLHTHWMKTSFNTTTESVRVFKKFPIYLEVDFNNLFFVFCFNKF